MNTRHLTATIDFESRSEVDIKVVGAWAYSEHPTTEILCMSWNVGDLYKGLWVPGLPFPQKLLDHRDCGGFFEAHYVIMETSMWFHQLQAKLDIKMPTRWRDTLAVCAYRSLPLGLDNVGEVLDLPLKKDKRGKYLIQKLCKPRKATIKDDSKWLEDWDLLMELYDYCDQDRDVEVLLSDMVGKLPDDEQLVWTLDWIINFRGIQVDLEAVQKAIGIIEIIEAKLTIELNSITDGEINTAGQIAKIRAWCGKQKFTMNNLTKEAVENALTDQDIPLNVKRVLEIRQALSKSSTKKLYKFLDCVNSDGRIRGMFQYHGAGTGRWAGRLVQPHNFPRGNVKLMDLLIDLIKLGGEDAIEAISFWLGDGLGGGVVEAIASSLRGMFIVKPGNKLYVGDFSAIEARVVMWLAEQEDALEAFRVYDKGEGPDIYCVMAEKLFKRSINKEDDPYERQLGKITILGCGYQMSWSKLQFQASKDYGVDLTETEARELVDTYRGDYSMVPDLWRGIETAAKNTVHTGNPHTYGRIGFEIVDDAAGRWLACKLPSGRNLWYYDPKIEIVPAPWDQDKLIYQLTYQGRNNKAGPAWTRVPTYGGMLVENIVQAISRDLMVAAMFRIEQKGYGIILTVHDEIGCETLDSFGTLEEFLELMTGPNPEWADGCPIEVEGWEGDRYRKA